MPDWVFKRTAEDDSIYFLSGSFLGSKNVNGAKAWLAKASMRRTKSLTAWFQSSLKLGLINVQQHARLRPLSLVITAVVTTLTAVENFKRCSTWWRWPAWSSDRRRCKQLNRFCPGTSRNRKQADRPAANLEASRRCRRRRLFDRRRRWWSDFPGTCSSRGWGFHFRRGPWTRRDFAAKIFRPKSCSSRSCDSNR